MMETFSKDSPETCEKESDTNDEPFGREAVADSNETMEGYVHEEAKNL